MTENASISDKYLTGEQQLILQKLNNDLLRN